MLLHGTTAVLRGRRSIISHLSGPSYLMKSVTILIGRDFHERWSERRYLSRSVEIKENRSSSASSGSGLTVPYVYEIENDSLASLSQTQSQSEIISFYFAEAVPVESYDKTFRLSSHTLGMSAEEQRLLHERMMAASSTSPPRNSMDQNHLSLEERQLQIERRQSAIGELESIEMTKKLMSMGKAASLKSLQKIFLQWYDPLYQQLDHEKELFKKDLLKSEDIRLYGPLLLQVPVEKIAVNLLNTTLNLVLKSQNEGVKLYELATAISNTLQTEKNYAQALSRPSLPSSPSSSTSPRSKRSQKEWLNDLVNSGGSVHSLNKKLKSLLNSTEWTPEMKLKIGSSLACILIDTCRDEEGRRVFLEETEQISYQKITKRIKLSSSVYQDIIQSDEDSHVDHENESQIEGESRQRGFSPFSRGTPRYLPMIIPPLPWTPSQCGGYLTLQTDLLRFRSKSQLSVLKNANLSFIYESLNYLGSIPWRINDPVMSVMRELYRREELVGDLPTQVILDEPKKEDCYIPLSRLQARYSGNVTYTSLSDDPPPFINEDGEEVVFDSYHYKYLCKRIKQKNAEQHSLRCDLGIKFNIATEFQSDVVYFPWNVDFRGRAYPIPPNLNHMGSDICRGVLYFATGKPLGKRGYEWLKCHLCNLFGNNKIPVEQRIVWTENHIQNILDCARNPLGDSSSFSEDERKVEKERGRWWTLAEEPYQALATCFEIANAYNSGNPESYICRLPIHQDGSCNGLQHYAALGRDQSGGSAVNLTPADSPQDVYTEVLKRVLHRIEVDISLELDSSAPIGEDGQPIKYSTPESLQLLRQTQQKRKKFAQLVSGKVDRKVIKQTVMTSVYGVTASGARDQVNSKLQEKLYPGGTLNREQEDESYQAAGYLARLTLLSLGDLFSSADEIMNWLGAVASAVGSQGHVMSWITPLGLPVMQPYRKQVAHTVRTILQDVTLSFDNEALPVSKQKQRTAFPPNYVHSLDSTHMMMTSLKMKERGLHFTAVHDSYWTHACDVDIMNEELRNCFVELYKLPLLENLKESIELRYPSIQLPPVPKRGHLDIDQVKDSRYFFH